MKTKYLRLLAIAALALAGVFISPTPASADSIRIQVGGAPPPPVVERQWGRPSPSAVWVRGHQEWIRGRWVWVSGYYTYPPHRGSVWVDGRYRHGYYYPGYWR
jgi:hypothetical protein